MNVEHTRHGEAAEFCVFKSIFVMRKKFWALAIFEKKKKTKRVLKIHNL